MKVNSLPTLVLLLAISSLLGGCLADDLKLNDNPFDPEVDYELVRIDSAVPQQSGVRYYYSVDTALINQYADFTFLEIFKNGDPFVGQNLNKSNFWDPYLQSGQSACYTMRIGIDPGVPRVKFTSPYCYSLN